MSCLGNSKSHTFQFILNFLQTLHRSITEFAARLKCIQINTLHVD